MTTVAPLHWERSIYVKLIQAFETVELSPLDRAEIADRRTILAALNSGLKALSEKWERDRERQVPHAVGNNHLKSAAYVVSGRGVWHTLRERNLTRTLCGRVTGENAPTVYLLERPVPYCVNCRRVIAWESVYGQRG